MTKILRLEISTFEFGVKFYFAARLFPPYFALLPLRSQLQAESGSLGFGHGRPSPLLASFAAASSNRKILRLEILHLNLKSNF
jgi:hypothetical protein